MQKSKQKLIVVCGPTATGKSDFAVALAQKIGGEIISADSRQVYRGLDIGSGKITSAEMQGVPHHLLDIADPAEPFSVAQYQQLASQTIKDIANRSKVPIICGGTGFYIDAVICNTVFPAVQPNPALRQELEKMSLEEVAARLKGFDKRRYDLVDKKNKVRLIRAIEIATALGSVPAMARELQYDIEWHYLDFPDDALKERIHNRLLKRMDSGMIAEVKNLHAEGLSWDRLEALGLEYRYLARYLQNKLTMEEMLGQLERAIWHYAKRQRTWFKKYAK